MISDNGDENIRFEDIEISKDRINHRSYLEDNDIAINPGVRMLLRKALIRLIRW